MADVLDRRLWPIWRKCLLVTVIAVAALGTAGFFAVRAAIQRFIPNPDFAGIVGALLAVFGAWLLWRVVALAVLQLFADEVVRAIEARDYPAQAADARPIGWRAELRQAAGAVARTLGYNLLALPFAVALLLTGVGAPLVFVAVNAVLLGRELQDMVWRRHSPGADPAPPLTGPERWALGGVTALLLTVPVINFAAPFFGAACAVHLIHRKGWHHGS